MKKSFLFVTVAQLAMCSVLYISSCRDDEQEFLIQPKQDTTLDSDTTAKMSASKLASESQGESDDLPPVEDLEIDTSTLEYSQRAVRNVGINNNYELKSYDIVVVSPDESIGTVTAKCDGHVLTGGVYHGTTVVAEVVSVAPNYEFVGWMSGNEVVSSALSYAFTATTDIELVASFRYYSLRAVDLGLSVRWANGNLGATSPDKYGDYFAWGETAAFGKEDYSNSMNYEYNLPHTYVKTFYSWLTYKFCRGLNPTMTKYCTNEEYGINDGRTMLLPTDDAAHVIAKSNWRIPTPQEMNELISKCTWVWTSLNGVGGFQVFGPSGKSIFLPAAGCRGYSSQRDGDNGYYWTSSIDEYYQCNAYCLYFCPNHVSKSYIGRYLGQSIRAVRE
ncbi:MAG: DUF1566 domain-containing protein [Bacteroidales bacterium]|nr:DUF1566 domain-containing protein [Bacteroidales bacterium]